MIDMNPSHLGTVKAILAEHVPECEVRAFGSRATWTAKDYSDLDLAVLGEGPLDWKTLSRLKEAFEESDLPMRVDVLDWHAISASFREVIAREYVVLWEGAKQIPPGQWAEVKLGDVCTKIGSGATPRGGKEAYVQNGPYALIRSQNVYNTGFTRDGLAFLSDEQAEALQNVEVLPEDVLLNITGDSVARVCQVDPLVLPARVNQHVAIIRPDPDKLDPAYLRYYLAAPEVQAMLLSWAGSGGTRNALTKQMIESFEIQAPSDLTEQRAIAHILGTLDDKIKLNRRMNETLEEMARGLFKSWFMDFEPVRAKMEGRWHRGQSLPGLPAEYYDLFPGWLVPSEFGEIPKGWEVGVLDDVIEILSGGTPSTSVSDYWDGDIPWYTAKDAPALSDIFVLTTERAISQAGVDNSSTKVLPAGTTVITARGTVGRLACLGIPMAMNQTCYGIRGVPGYPDYFTYWNLRHTVSELQARTHGTIFDTITRETFKIAEIVLAPTYVMRAFECVVTPKMKRILGNLNESRLLAAQRSALLPKLVSGEVRVE